MLAKEPEDRPASADAVVRELKSIAKMLSVEMTQLSGFARALPEPEPVSRSRARGAAAPQETGNRPALTPALGGPTTSRFPPRQGSPAHPKPRNASDTLIPSVTEAELPRTLISGSVASSPVASSPVASSPVAPETDVLPVKPRHSPGMKLAAVGVGLAVVLLGAGVGLVMFRDEGDKPNPLPVAPATLTVMRPISGSPTEPPPLPKQEPGNAGSQQVDAVPTGAQAQVETPSRTETQPSTQTEVTAQGEASAVQKPDTTASPRKDLVVAVTPRPRPARPKVPGTLQIVAKCWGDVYIDNEFIKRAPVQALPLSAGKHKVELRGNPTIKQPSVTLFIPSGKLIEHTFFCGTSG
jgi:serine/threonine-protein kinase